MTHTPETKAAAQCPPDHKRSKGEKIFDWSVYGGMNWVGTLILTVPVAYALEHGKTCANLFKSTAEKLSKLGIKDEHSRKSLLQTFTLMQGGNLMIIPIKWAENRKAELVAKTNHMLGEKDDYICVKKAADQTWTSLLKSRLVAFGTVWVGFEGTRLALGGKKEGSRRFAEFEKKFATWACKKMNKATHVGVEESRAFKLSRIAALDIFATTASTTILYIASRFFAEPDKDFPKAPKDPLGNSIIGDQPMLSAPESTEPIADRKTSHSNTREAAGVSTTPRSLLSRTAASQNHSEAVIRSKQEQNGLILPS